MNLVSGAESWKDGPVNDTAWESLVQHLSRLETLHGVLGTLGWDEQTMMPKNAAPLRGRQRALLAELAHEWLVDERVGGWLDAIEGSDDPVRRACHRNLGREHRRERGVPAALVGELARARTEGFAAWIDAKKASDFSLFLPSLERLPDLV